MPKHIYLFGMSVTFLQQMIPKSYSISAHIHETFKSLNAYSLFHLFL